MLRNSTHAARRRRPASFALALALAAGGMLGVALLETPASAQRAPRGEKAENANSRDFAKAYEPFGAILSDPAADAAAARRLIPTVEAAVSNAADKMVMGHALITLGDRLKDDAIQEKGIRLALESGLSTPEQTGLFHYFLARSALQKRNFAEARTHYKASYDAGYREGDPDAMIADTYFGEGRNAEGLAHLKGVIASKQAAGESVPDSWIARGLSVATTAKLEQQANEFVEMLLRKDTTPDNWLKVVAVSQSFHPPADAQEQLDVLRFLMATNTLTERRQYEQYIDTAESSGLPAEVVAVFDHGVGAGVLSPSDSALVAMKNAAVPRAETDRKEVPAIVGEARAAANGRVALGAGNAFYSLRSWAEAEEMFRVALDKGVADRDLVLTRLGMAQVQQGKYTEAKATLAQVGGNRAALARLWSLYADTRAGA